MAKPKQKSPIEGRWNIISMTEWDEEYLHEEVLAFIEIDPRGVGSFHFGYLRGRMKHRAVQRDGKPGVEFTWEGFDEMVPESGTGWAVLENDRLTGVLTFDDDDESGFLAVRAEPSGTPQGSA